MTLFLHITILLKNVLIMYGEIPIWSLLPCCSFNEKTLKADKLRLSSWIFKYCSERVHTPRSSLERNASWEADKESTYSASRMNACKKEKI